MKTEGKFILDGTKLVPVYDLIEWATWIETNSTIATDEIGKVKVSTTFFGLDIGHVFGRPQLFETMVFGGGADPYAYGRYATYDEAIAGHADALNLVRSNLNLIDETVGK